MQPQKSTIVTEKMVGAEPKPPEEPVYACFDGPNDPDHPYNWTPFKKIAHISIVSAKIFVVSFGSSVFGAATTVLTEEFHTSKIVMQLGVALYVAGFAIGPLVSAPLSEIYGNLPPIVISCASCAIFQIPLGLAQNVATILVSRFLAGTLGGALFGVGSGAVSELYEPIPRGAAMGFSVSAINLGSAAGPVVGSFVVARFGWRWTVWVTLLMFVILEPIAFFTLKESVPKRILVAKAKRLRKQSGCAIVAPAEEEKIDFHVLARKYLSKPVRLFYHEPILIVLTIHLTFVYGLLYLAYQLLPLAFQRRGWSVPHSTLPFIAVCLGAMAAPIIIATFTLTWYKRRVLSRGGIIVPEDRLPPMIAGAAMLPLSLLWFGWSMSTHWFCQVMATYFIGTAVLLIFVTGITYIVDVYPTSTNSAAAIHVVIRSTVAATFPLWTGPFYDALGVEWMATVLGAFGALLFPAPIIFMIYGKRIRSWSSYADA